MIRNCVDCDEEFEATDRPVPGTDLTARQIRCKYCLVAKHFG